MKQLYKFLIVALFATGAIGASPTPIKLQATSLTYTGVAFSDLNTLPQQTNLTTAGCFDCQIATVCAGGGTGAIATKLNGVWSCSQSTGGGGGSSFPLATDADFNGHKGFSSAVGTTNGDLMVFGLNHLNDLAPATGVYSMNNNKIQGISPGTLTNDALVYGQAGAYLQSLTVDALAINGIITVTVPPYGAVGDGTTDDTPAIQSAIYAACNTTNPPVGHPLLVGDNNVYFPKPDVCYATYQPLRIPCQGIGFYGDGQNVSGICPHFNGNVVIQEDYGTPGGVQFTTSLVTGSGQAIVSGTNSLGSSYDLNRWLSIHVTGNANWASNCSVNSQCSISGFYRIDSGTGGTILESKYPSQGPLTSANGMFKIALNGSNKLTAQVNLLTSGSHSFAACTAATTTATVYQWLLDFDGTTWRVFNGAVGGLAELCDSFVSSNKPTQSPMEQILLPPVGSSPYWPNQSGPNDPNTPFVGAEDSILFWTNSLHTAPYIVPSTKNSSTQPHDDLLMNFETGPDGTIMGRSYTDVANPNGRQIYFTELNRYAIGYTSGVNMHDIDLCSNNLTPSGLGADGLYAVGGDGGTYKNMRCTKAGKWGGEFAGNDFFDVVDNFTSNQGDLGFIYGAAWNSSTVSNEKEDLTNVACSVHVGGGIFDTGSRCVDRGGLMYGWLGMETGGLFDNLAMDQETTNTTYLETWYQKNATGSAIFSNSTLPHQAGKPNALVDGTNGYGPAFTNQTSFDGFGEPSEFVHFNATPRTPAIFDNVKLSDQWAPLSNLPQYALLFGPNGLSGLNYLRPSNIPTLAGAMISGGINLAALTTPVAPVLTKFGSAGATSYGPFYGVCHDATGQSSATSTGSGTIANGVASLNSNNYLIVNFSTLPLGCATLDLLAGDTAHSVNGYQGIIPTADKVDQSYRIIITAYAVTAGYTNPADSGQAYIAGLKTPGAATGLKVICADTSNGKMVTSASSTECATTSASNIANVNFAASPYTILTGTEFVRCDATGGAVVINMPLATATGRRIYIKKMDGSANACTATRAGGDLIDGATTAPSATQYQSKSFSDGAAGVWDIF